MKRVVSSESDSDDVVITPNKVKAHKIALTAEGEGALHQFADVSTQPPVAAANDGEKLATPKKKRSKKGSSGHHIETLSAETSPVQIPLPVPDLDQGKRKKSKTVKVGVTEGSTAPPQDVGSVAETVLPSTSGESKVKKHKKKKVKEENH